MMHMSLKIIQYHYHIKYLLSICNYSYTFETVIPVIKKKYIYNFVNADKNVIIAKARNYNNVDMYHF